jgi:diguanylate cyclase (GGDEF)-like protein
MKNNQIRILLINSSKKVLSELTKVNKDTFYINNINDSVDLFFSKDINFIITEINNFNDLSQLELFRAANKNMPIIIYNNKEISFKLMVKLSFLEIKGFYLKEEFSELLKKVIENIYSYKESLKDKKFLYMLNSVMDSHKEIIFSIEHEDILYANKKFFEFFQVDSLKTFHSKYISLQNLILKHPLTELYLDKPITTLDFIDYLYSIKEEHRTIALKDYNTGDIKLFLIKISFIKEGYRLFNLVDITDMVKKHCLLEEKAHIDALTKVYNRHRFQELVEELEFDYCLLMIDIDNFKRLNDTYGHDIGDISLREIANIIKSNIRKSDILARWGGEEFILILPKTNYLTGLKIANSIRTIISKTNIEHVGCLTISIGVSHTEFGDSLENIRLLADKCLYEAKKQGRNIVIGSDLFLKIKA